MVTKKKPRLLLINPWIFDFSAYDLWSKPLGLLYIASYLRKIGYEIDYIDCLDKNNPFFLKKIKGLKVKTGKYGSGHFYREKVKKPALLEFIPRFYARYGLSEDVFLSALGGIEKPDAILITSLMTYWYLGPQRVVELVRNFFRGVPVILGGIYSTLLNEHAKTHVKPDYIITGPGELQVAQLLCQILPGAPEDPFPPQNLDDFPAPAFDLYSKLDYLIVMTSRGCPYHCTFCATEQISGGYVQRNPAHVVEEILKGTKKYAVKNVAFYDDALFLNKKNRIIPILQALIQSKTRLNFHTPNGVHTCEISSDLAELLFANSFKTIRLSFESVSPERREDMKDKVTPDDLEIAVKNLEQAGFQRNMLAAYVIFGLPNQPLEEVYESILFVNSLGIKVSLASFSPIPGTVDYERAIAQGLLPRNPDPLITNNSIYPLYPRKEDYIRFNSVRQFVQVLNEGIDRGVRLTHPIELKKALKNFLKG
jgi:radical SAM superfamily enzyme YgiQ (UPF0313 family)